MRWQGQEPVLLLGERLRHGTGGIAGDAPSVGDGIPPLGEPGFQVRHVPEGSRRDEDFAEVVDRPAEAQGRSGDRETLAHWPPRLAGVEVLRWPRRPACCDGATGRWDRGSLMLHARATPGPVGLLAIAVVEAPFEVLLMCRLPAEQRLLVRLRGETAGYSTRGPDRRHARGRFK